MNFDKVIYQIWTFADFEWVFHADYEKLKEAEEDAARLPYYSEYKILRVESKTLKTQTPDKPVYFF